MTSLPFEENRGGGGASGGERPVVIWRGGNGYYELSIHADGRAVYQVQSGGFGLPSTPPPPIVGSVSSDRMASLRSLLAKHADALRETRPPLRNLIPDESTQSLEVDWGDLNVRLTMLSNDWSSYPASDACADELHLLASKIAEGRR